MPEEHIARQATLAGINKTTTDHQEVRSWVEARGGRPVRMTFAPSHLVEGDLGIDFSGQPSDSYRPISWDEFFRLFEERKLAFVYQVESVHGEEGLFNMLVQRDVIKKGSKDRSQLRQTRDIRHEGK